MSLFDLPPPGSQPEPGRPGPAIPAAAAAKASPDILGVSELTGRIAGSLSSLGKLVVEGEVSAFKRAGSGHLYFQLKDDRAALACAVWRSRVATGVRFDLADGQQVLCHGTLDVYAPRGSYSLIVERIEPRGMGEQLAKLERLKQSLREQGWFDRARPIPPRPRCIGLVTSRDADALRDFLRTRSLRWPGYPVRLCHTRVQGPGAAQEIAGAIARMDDGQVDVICVVRGGGSLEDLWAFNELPVAEAVWNCSVPVISGVGHESDTTLIDWVADHRAHTPTNAAESAIPDRKALLERLERAAAYLESAMERQLQARERTLDRLVGRSGLSAGARFLRAPELQVHALEKRLRLALANTLQSQSHRVERLGARLAAGSPQARLASLEVRLEALTPRLNRAMAQEVERAQARLQDKERWLEAISPLAVLGRGYALVQDASGRVLRAAKEAVPGTQIAITLAEGRIESEVRRILNEGPA
ncbi:MAG: exodeoxyribonuclease VII large subunit [Planctomycetes bacterium]|nr:exodeoxyribonuclease VII large subunit [Planctomycetota bacterium]MCB9909447.1 exodeoxyribonuclease VII large subunit [Planctomycetota bacterium]HPF13019.1 exodeoxyribonuclease VII large subunit [Planctomycetota bacterium]